SSAASMPRALRSDREKQFLVVGFIDILTSQDGEGERRKSSIFPVGSGDRLFDSQIPGGIVAPCGRSGDIALLQTADDVHCAAHAVKRDAAPRQLHAFDSPQ